MQKQSILEVEILLWYACRATDFPNLDAPAVKSAIQDFVKMGILHKNEIGQNEYSANQQAIDAYVAAVLKVPLPKQVWCVQ